MRKELDELRKRKEESDRDWDAKQRRHETEYRERMSEFDVKVRPHLHPASANDFKRWLKGFLDNGGVPRHMYDYPRDRTYVAHESFEMVPMFGASSLDIIAMKGVKITGQKGHCNIFYMDNFVCDGTVSIHIDTII